MRVAVLEDEAPAREQLLGALAAADAQVEVVACLDTVEAAAAWLDTRPALDLLFADVHLADGSALTLLREERVACPVVFATAEDAYLLDALRCASIDYLLKPIAREDVARALARYRALEAHFRGATPAPVLAAALSPERPRRRIIVRHKGALRVLAVEEVAYLRAEDKLTLAVTHDGQSFIVDHPLAELQAELDPATFFRANRAYLVAVRAVRAFRPGGKGRVALLLAPDPGGEVLVSQERAAAFRAWVDR